jgi:hypothetical protein
MGIIDHWMTFNDHLEVDTFIKWMVQTMAMGSHAFFPWFALLDHDTKLQALICCHISGGFCQC